MKHSPLIFEQETIDYLLEAFQFEFVPIRLTETMLGKSIMDSRSPLRHSLRKAGLIEYQAIAQGEEHKVQLGIPFITAHGVEKRKVSFYRPVTKKGDPRISVERLSNAASPGDLLLFLFYGGELAALLVKGDKGKIASGLRGLLPFRYEEQGVVERTVRALQHKIEGHDGQWIPTRRAGPTGVGYTLESLLGISANTSQIADVDGVEIKAFRRGAVSGLGKLVTLFSKTPEWHGNQKGLFLLEKYGYNDLALGRKALYCTIVRKPNTLGLALSTMADIGRLYVTKKDEIALSYSLGTLEKRLYEKHPATLFVTASFRGSGWKEEFRYDEIVLCRNPSFTNFLDLVDNNLLGLDLTLSCLPTGRARDHGYLWRIREQSIPELFAYRRCLTSRT